MAGEHFIQGAIKRPGALKRAAANAGESLSAFMKQHHKSTRIQREVNLAKTLRKLAKRRGK